MMTYVYLKDADNIELKDVLMENLPTFDPEQVWAEHNERRYRNSDLSVYRNMLLRLSLTA